MLSPQHTSQLGVSGHFRHARLPPLVNLPVRGTTTQRTLPVRSLNPGFAEAVDVAQPAAELVLRVASQAASHIADSTHLASALHALSPYGVDINHMVAGLDGSSISAVVGDISSQGADAASTILSSGVSTEAVSASATLLHDIASMQGIHEYALSRLAVVQTMDMAAYDTLRTSLDSLMMGVQGMLSATTSQMPEATLAGPVPWTNALVLGMQHLVTSLRGPGVNIEAMLAAQEAMSVAMTSTAVDASAAAVTATGTMQALARGAAVSELPAGVTGLMQLVLALTAMIIAALPKNDWKAFSSAADTSEVSIPTRYDVPQLNAYFATRPMRVLQRNTDVVGSLSSFCLAVLSDRQLGRWETNMASRAAWLCKIVEGLGPAYIKIAQMVSTRVDIMPEEYISEFAKLQDNVKRFSTVEARQVLEEGLQMPADAVFDWLSEEPIAAASLGQVYRGKLRAEYGGGEVAVKVQRPGALENVALDIFIMRRAAQLFSQLPGMSDKWAQALDDWAVRFFQEMDYTMEAQNSITFQQHMSGLQGIKVATVYPQLTSRKIIVSEWIEGERLGESSTEDVRALCSTLLNCYLIQLLETGLLHADPHPGNLMRTADGKIVVLDFGLMTEVTEDQRIALVEYIAHLSVEDWEGVAHDLVTLGFMPDGMPPNAAPLIAPVMQKVMGQLVKGGGLKNGLSITGIATELSGVALSHKLCVPPYFALVLRAFSVIEGIALKVDPQYAIVNECMPYMSRRLLTDNNPRMRAALKQLLYGKGTRLDVDRLQRMLSQFSSFTTSAQPTGAAGAAQLPPRLTSGPTFSQAYTSGGYVEQGLLGGVLGLNEGPVLSEPMKEMLKVVFSKDGNYAQELLVDEAVAAIDAMSREALGEALKLVAVSATAVGSMRGAEALGPLRMMLMPSIGMPGMGMLHAMQPAVALSSEDRQALGTIRAILDLVMPNPGVPTSPNPAAMSMKAARVAGEMAPMLPELLPGMQSMLELFTRQLVRRMALRLAEDLDAAGKQAAATRALQAEQARQAPAPMPPAGTPYGAMYPPQQQYPGYYPPQPGAPQQPYWPPMQQQQHQGGYMAYPPGTYTMPAGSPAPGQGTPQGMRAPPGVGMPAAWQ